MVGFWKLCCEAARLEQSPIEWGARQDGEYHGEMKGVLSSDFMVFSSMINMIGASLYLQY